MSRKSSFESKNYSNAYYNYSSEAYEYYPDEKYTRKRPKRRKKSEAQSKRKEYKKNRKKAKKNINEKYKYKLVAYENPGHSIQIYFTIFIVFVFSLATLFFSSYNTEQKDYINKLNSELKKIQENNSYLQTELAQNLDLDKVEKLAAERLGMQKPASYQMVYINIPKQSYTVQYQPKSKNNDKKDFTLDNILNSIFKD